MRNNKLQYLILFGYTAAEDGTAVTDATGWHSCMKALVAAVQYGAWSRIQATREDANWKWKKALGAKPLVCMMPEIHEVHQLASGEAKPKAQSLPVLVRIVRLGRHENFEIGVPLAAPPEGIHWRRCLALLRNPETAQSTSTGHQLRLLVLRSSIFVFILIHRRHRLLFQPASSLLDSFSPTLAQCQTDQHSPSAAAAPANLSGHGGPTGQRGTPDGLQRTNSHGSRTHLSQPFRAAHAESNLCALAACLSPSAAFAGDATRIFTSQLCRIGTA
ncbi:hypothetical protein TGAM01_v205848 [Trichoderma gamsii]|uniref:Uncharacterized protein n=1 Tax=Trichoderma gamsii TaxID=398673 RepID=A0A2P4ZLJ8_9HYPO|nr:hypothetical protein TGAM01_v205848 [Trichoderma gamsii]PON25162.1 hypothetical protein TGAM01_v205848 [Trichoderma gamsii]